VAVQFFSVFPRPRFSFGDGSAALSHSSRSTIQPKTAVFASVPLHDLGLRLLEITLTLLGRKLELKAFANETRLWVKSVELFTYPDLIVILS
jgi:hypothetical protein